MSAFQYLGFQFSGLHAQVLKGFTVSCSALASRLSGMPPQLYALVLMMRMVPE